MLKWTLARVEFKDKEIIGRWWTYLMKIKKKTHNLLWIVPVWGYWLMAENILINEN